MYGFMNSLLFQKIIYYILGFITILFDRFRSIMYDLFLTPYTTKMNRKFLKSVPPDSKIIDIGIGTGKAMTNNSSIIKDKGIKVLGYDIDPGYVKQCLEHIKSTGLEDNIVVNLKDIYDENKDLKVDYVLFSDSYAVIPNVNRMIKYSTKFLKPNGKIIILTTLDDDNNLLQYKRSVKPKIKSFTTLEFGKVTSLKEFREGIDKLDLKISNMQKIYEKNFIGYGPVKSYMVEIVNK